MAHTDGHHLWSGQSACHLLDGRSQQDEEREPGLLVPATPTLAVDCKLAYRGQHQLFPEQKPNRL